MTCKDCFHYEACNSLVKDMSGYKYEMPSTQGFVCKHFKDKSKIVELPCKVGDILYIAMPELYGNQIIKAFVNEVIINHGETKILVYYELHHNGRIHTLYIGFFGKTVFLSPEEAEKALKERSNK